MWTCYGFKTPLRRHHAAPPSQPGTANSRRRSGGRPTGRHPVGSPGDPTELAEEPTAADVLSHQLGLRRRPPAPSCSGTRTHARSNVHGRANARGPGPGADGRRGRRCPPPVLSDGSSAAGWHGAGTMQRRLRSSLARHPGASGWEQSGDCPGVRQSMKIVVHHLRAIYASFEVQLRAEPATRLVQAGRPRGPGVGRSGNP